MMRTPQGRIVSDKSWSMFGLTPPSYPNVIRRGARKIIDDQQELPF